MLGLTDVNINISPNAGPHIHAGVNIKQFYQNTATLLKPSIICDRVNSEDIAAAKRELFDTAEH